MARRYNIPVIVDGAHAFGHFTFKHEDLDCDYYASSLHKWLFAPHGTGLLYVRKDKIADLWPLMAAPDPMTDNIRKYEEIGTHPAANYLAIAEALTFHQGIGAERKEARLRYLTDYWIDALTSRSDRVTINTPRNPDYYCAIANVDIDGIEPVALKEYLWKKHRIFTVPILHEDFRGIRVTPSVYSTMEEVERFISAMDHAITHGVG
jgi:selenocysteine lyase/cysteine desulfurase